MMNFQRKPALARACFFSMLAGALGLAGCGRDSIEVYSVPKAEEFVPQRETAQAPRSSFVPDEVAWQLPQGWEEAPSSRMGEKAFHIDLADGSHLDASLIPFPSMRGKEAMVVNIWRGQMQLDPVSESEVAGVAIPVKVGSADAQMFDLVNPDSTSPLGERTIVAMLHQGMATWFFKLNGSASAVEAAKPSFLEFLHGVTFKPTPHPPTGSGVAASVPATSGASTGGGLPSWTVPSNWEPRPPGRMLLAAFESTNDVGTGQVTVSAFPGSVGGLLANVNRWRGQLGLAPAGNEAELGDQIEPVESLGNAARLITLENGGQGMLAIMLPSSDGKTWFYKLTGSPAFLHLEKANLISFVDSAGQSPAASRASAPTMVPSASPAASGLPDWTVPEGWQPQAPGRMVLAAFQVTNSTGRAAATVTAFPGSVGGLLANVNRWRGQLGIGPAASEAALGEQVAPVESLGESARLIRLENGGRGILAVMLTLPDKTWFYKLTGTPEVLEMEKSKLIAFVQSAGHEVR